MNIIQKETPQTKLHQISETTKANLLQSADLLARPMDSLVMRNVAQLAGLSNHPNSSFSKVKRSFFLRHPLVLYLIYGMCLSRLLFYSVNLEKLYLIEEMTFLLHYDFFLGASRRADLKLDMVMLLSLAGIPLSAIGLLFTLPRVGQTGRVKRNRTPNSTTFLPLAVHLYDVVNRNAAQLEEAVGGANGYLTFSYRELLTEPFTTLFRLERTLAELLLGLAPLPSGRRLPPLRLYPFLSPLTRQRILFWAVGTELFLKAAYVFLGTNIHIKRNYSFYLFNNLTSPSFSSFHSQHSFCPCSFSLCTATSRYYS